MSGIVLGTFAGPGGWAVAAAALGIPEVGIELDGAACATRAAAGHKTIRADVAGYPLEQLAGKVSGFISSPPCTTFSAAGKRAGTAVTDVLEAMILDGFEGAKTRAAHRREMARMLRMAWWPNRKLTRTERSAAIWKAVRSASLVAEPARYIYACRPEWVALEQVPAVLPLWEVYAAELRRTGYSAWAAVLNAADYGVAQVRERAFLIASRAHQVTRPESTHYDPRKGGQLWGAPWVTMADALGWGMTERPYFTLATAGGNRGGADEQVGGSGARKALYAERDSGRWVFERPATTVLADPRLGRPGHKGRENGGEAHFAVGSVRLTPAQAAALQSFPRGYPFSGSATRAHQQIGNAVPPLLAEHVLAMATGIQRLEAAA
jgi:DNA (cytosine-5)-methyltransferase 1